MDKNDFINRYESGERDFIGVNLSEANLSYANLSGANLEGANLRGANLSDADFRFASLSNANLSDAKLICANLSKANLWNANLWNANLSEANLGYAKLSCADLSYANLSDADFRFASLSEANLSKANLWNANLGNTNLGYANLVDANLRGTILDPENEFDPLSEEEFLSAGFEVDDGMVVGYRTKMSVVFGDTIYVPGETYTAPVFSTDTETECHPGIYLAPLSWMKANVYPRWSLVKVSAAIPDVLKCGDKWRARKIVVIEDC